MTTTTMTTPTAPYWSGLPGLYRAASAVTLATGIALHGSRLFVGPEFFQQQILTPLADALFAIPMITAGVLMAVLWRRALLRALWEKTRDEFIPLCEGYQFHTALERAMGFLTETNKYVEVRAPFKLAKSADPTDQALLRMSLATMAEALRLAVALIQHITPTASEKINAVLGYKPGAAWREELEWGNRLTGMKVAESLVLFPRPQPPAAEATAPKKKG